MIQRHENAGSAEAALQRMVPPECSLQDAEPVHRRRETLYCADLAAIYLDGKREARTRYRAIDSHGTSSANAVFATHMRARRTDLLPQKVRQQQAWLRLAFGEFTVKRKADWMAAS
jgi:hypothetical protein